MLDNLEEEKSNIPESPENTETNEGQMETSEQLDNFAKETTEQIVNLAEEVKATGEDQVKDIDKNYEITPQDLEPVEVAIGEVDVEVNELADSTQEEVRNISIEKIEEPTQEETEDIDKEELREFTQEDKEEERNELAKKIKEERQEFFEKKKEAETKMEEIKSDIENKTEDIDVLKIKLQSTKETINEKSTSIFNRFFERAQIKELEKTSEETEPKIKNLEEELQNLLSLEEELAGHLEQKLDIDKLQQEVQDFYDSNIDNFKANQEQNRIEELERLEREEEGRKVENIIEEQKVTFIHAIRDDYVPTLNSMLKKGVGFEEKLKMLLSLDPTISTSTIKEGDGFRNMWGNMGVVLSNGVVEDASRSDAATKAEGISKRLSAGKNSIEDIDKSINNKGDRYNELVVSAPEIAGMFLSSNRGKIDISDKEFFRIAEELNMPTYFVDKGEFFEVSWGEEGPDFDPEFPPLIVGEKVDPAKIKENAKIFNAEEKKEMFNGVIEKDVPFQVESLLPEARSIESRNNGIEEYIKLKGNSLAGLNEEQEIDAKDLGIDPEEENWKDKRILEGNKVKILQEIIYVDGSKKRYIENNGKVYEQECSNKKESFGTLSLIDGQYTRYDQFIEISYNTHKLDRELNSPEDYLEGMKKSIVEFQKEMSAANLEKDSTRESYEDIKNRLAFHLNGFADTAEKFKDTDTAEKARKLAQELLSSKDYEEIIERRIDNNGKFKITKEDLE